MNKFTNLHHSPPLLSAQPAATPRGQAADRRWHAAPGVGLGRRRLAPRWPRPPPAEDVGKKERMRMRERERERKCRYRYEEEFVGEGGGGGDENKC